VRILIVIPAFNEEQALGGLLDEIREVKLPNVDIDVVVVDDGSTDRTSAVTREKNVRLLRLFNNLGIGGAVQAGLKLAHREGFDYAVQIDGDGQHPPAEIERLLAAAADHDLVVGTRFTDEKTFRSTLMRRLGSKWLRMILRVVGVRISDPTSGLRLYGKRALRLFSETYPYDFPEPESLSVARAAGLSLAETSVKMRERQGGRSSILGFAPLYYMLKVTLAIALSYMRAPRRPKSEEPWNQK
jgi:glycosyltransferase involved in cell wall biosynthesis